MPVNLPCAKCELTDNCNGLYTCNGCRRSFCPNHIDDHSTELRNRFEEIIYEYNSLNEVFCDYKQKPNGSQWKINKIDKEINQIKSQIDESGKMSNYSEKALNEWMKRLTKLKTQLTKSNSSMYEYNRLLIFTGFGLCLSTILIIFISKSSFSNIRFSDIDGPIQLLGDEHVAEYNGSDFSPGSFRVSQIYLKDIHHVRLTLEKFSLPNTFIGVIGSQGEQSISASRGWFIGQGEYEVFPVLRKMWSFFISDQPEHDYIRDIKQGDTVAITIDCIKSKIGLRNERTDVIYELNIDQKQFPFPWQIFITLDHHGDRVRLHLQYSLYLFCHKIVTLYAYLINNF